MLTVVIKYYKARVVCGIDLDSLAQVQKPADNPTGPFWEYPYLFPPNKHWFESKGACFDAGFLNWKQLAVCIEFKLWATV